MNRNPFCIDVNFTIRHGLWFANAGIGTLSPNAPNYSPNAPNYTHVRGVVNVLLVHVVVSTEAVSKLDVQLLVLFALCVAAVSLFALPLFPVTRMVAHTGNGTRSLLGYRCRAANVRRQR